MHRPLKNKLMITLTINGRRRELEGPTNLIDFLHASGVNLQFIAVAHNGDVLHKDEYANVLFKDGDVLEVVRPVGGG